MKTILLMLILLSSIGCNQDKEVTDYINENEKEEEWVQTPSNEYGSEFNSELPNILVIGDSISIGLTGPLNELMSGYDVFHPADNCRNSYFTRQNLGRWIENPMYTDGLEVILWNNGIWDTVTAADGEKSTSPIEWFGTSLEDYEDNMRAIATKLKATGKRIIFFTTTEVTGGPFIMGKENALNDIAKTIMNDFNIEVIDLYQYAIDVEAVHNPSYDVHFVKESNYVLAQYVKDFILSK